MRLPEMIYTEEEMQKLRNQLSHWKVKFGEKSAQYRVDTKDLREKNKHQAFALKTMQEKNSQLKKENKKLKEDNYNELQRLGLENYELRKENKKLKEICDVHVPRALKLEEEIKIKKSKNITEIIGDCIILAFFCFMCSGMLCILFMMITDIIMGFQFVRYV